MSAKGIPRVPGSASNPAALQRLVRMYYQDGLTKAELGRRFGHSRGWVAAQLVRLAPSSSQGQYA